MSNKYFTLEKDMPKPLVTYSSADEVIVTTLKNEHNTIREYFTLGGRDLEEYDRNEMKDGEVCISCDLRAS
jgi:hypothetical protein